MQSASVSLHVLVIERKMTVMTHLDRHTCLYLKNCFNGFLYSIISVSCRTRNTWVTLHLILFDIWKLLFQETKTATYWSADWNKPIMEWAATADSEQLLNSIQMDPVKDSTLFIYFAVKRHCSYRLCYLATGAHWNLFVIGSTIPLIRKWSVISKASKYIYFDDV